MLVNTAPGEHETLPISEPGRTDVIQCGEFWVRHSLVLMSSADQAIQTRRPTAADRPSPAAQEKSMLQ